MDGQWVDECTVPHHIVPLPSTDSVRTFSPCSMNWVLLVLFFLIFLLASLSTLKISWGRPQD